jgi:acyl carrier protein
MTVPPVGAGTENGAVTDSDFADRLIGFISSTVATDDTVIADDTDLLLTGLVDSLGVVMIVEWIEMDRGITIDAADVVLEHFQSVEAIVAFLGTK